MEDHSDKIQDYIEGLLDGEELTLFEARLAMDNELKNMVALQREVYEILNAPIREKPLKKTLAEVNQHYGKAYKSSSAFIKRWLSIIAMTCVFFVCLFFFFEDSQTVYELPLMHSEAIRGEVGNVHYEKAVQAFNAGKYKEAEVLLAVLSVQNAEQIQYQYYLALSHLGAREWGKAIDLLSPIANGPSVFALEANYYLAVAYYEKGDVDNAKMYLNKIPAEGNLGEKSSRLQKKID